jgi:hypothetical protein
MKERNLLSEVSLYQIIEKLREQMVRLAMEKGSLTHHAVVELSQQLDEYIVRWQQLMKEKKQAKGLQLRQTSA